MSISIISEYSQLQKSKILNFFLLLSAQALTLPALFLNPPNFSSNLQAGAIVEVPSGVEGSNQLSGESVIEVVIKIPTWLEKPIVFLVLLYRRIRYGYPFRRIRLTQGKCAIIDSDDYYRLSKYKWYAAKGHNTFYVVRGKWSKIPKKRFEIRMHRIITNAPAHLYVDHVNHNGLDNRKANLRLATCSQSVCNRKKFAKPATSRYKGISWSASAKKWAAFIQTNSKKKYLGCFDDEIEAAKAYDTAAKKYHGEFGVLNFKS